MTILTRFFTGPSFPGLPGIQVIEPLATKQAYWDSPGILVDQAIVQASLADIRSCACFLAVVAPHSGNWQQTLPISNCGLKLDGKAIRVAVGLQLGLQICIPHTCPCGALVDADGLHVFV